MHYYTFKGLCLFPPTPPLHPLELIFLGKSELYVEDILLKFRHIFVEEVGLLLTALLKKF